MIQEEVKGKYCRQELKASDHGLFQKKIYFLKVKSLSMKHMYTCSLQQEGKELPCQWNWKMSSRHSFTQRQDEQCHVEKHQESHVCRKPSGFYRATEAFELWSLEGSNVTSTGSLDDGWFWGNTNYSKMDLKNSIWPIQNTYQRGENGKKAEKLTMDGNLLKWIYISPMDQLKIDDQILCQEFKHLNELITFIEEDHWSERKELQKMFSR